MSKPTVIKERTRYKYATEEEAREAKSKLQKENHLKNLEENRKKNAEYQRKYRALKKQEKEANDKLLAELLLAQNTACIPIVNNNVYVNQ